jgi:hypothetical protein
MGFRFRRKGFGGKYVMADIKIEDSFPIPLTTPYEEMEVGQSFFVPGLHNGRSVINSARSNCARLGIKLRVRPIVENGVEGWRIRRVE